MLDSKAKQRGTMKKKQRLFVLNKNFMEPGIIYSETFHFDTQKSRKKTEDHDFIDRQNK